MAKAKDVYSRLKSYEPLWGNWYLAEDRAIGSGASGSVYLLKDELMKDDIKYSVVKVITQELGPEWKSHTQEEREQKLSERKDALLEEIKLMLKLGKKPHLVHCLNYETKDFNDENGALIGFDVLIRMELLTCLSERLREDGIEIYEVEELARQMGTALYYMHEIKMLHRDIKPGNIYIDDDTGDFLLGDFGISKQASSNSFTTYAGTPDFMAPEVTRSINNRIGSSKNEYTLTADIYTYGLVLYYLLNECKLPFMEAMDLNSENTALLRRLNGEIFPEPKNGSATLKAVVMKCCEFKPEDRYQSMSEVLAELGCEPSRGYEKGAVIVSNASNDPYKTFYANSEKATVSGDSSEDRYKTVSANVSVVSNEIVKESEDDGIDRALLERALNGDSDAQYDIGFCYYDGSGVEQNDKKAVYWYTKAAELGNNSAQNDLGLCYENGTGVPKDDKKAVYLYTKAAESGNIYAQYNLATCYKNGLGTPQDFNKAVYWYKKSADGGLEMAKSALAELGYWE